MSLTPPPPPPPPPPHRPSNLIPSGCKTPILAPSTRRLSTATRGSSSSDSVPSPNQLRQILADITKQVTNSPQSRVTSSINNNHLNNNPNQTSNNLNTFMRPSYRQTGPVTRSRSMLRHVTPRSSITPRGTRSNTPVRDENHQINPLVIQTPRTPFNLTNSPSSRSILPGSPAYNQNNNRYPIAPLRYRTLSSVSSITTSLSSPTTPVLTSTNTIATTTTDTNNTTTTTTTTSTTAPSDPQSPHPTPSSSTSSNLRSSLRFNGSHRSTPTPPLTPSSSSNSHTTSNLSDNTSIQVSTLRERRSLDQVESPSDTHNSCSLKPPNSNASSSSGSLAKRRRRNPSAFGRL